MLLVAAVLALAMCAVPTLGGTRLFDGAGKTPKNKVGTTLEAVLGVNSTCPWVNLMRCAPVFVVRSANGGWVNPASVALLVPSGYPVNMTTNMIATTALLSGLDGHYEGGVYDLTHDGSGNVSVSGDAANTSTTSGAMSFVVTPGSRGIVLVIRTSSLTDPVRNISVTARAVQSAATTGPHWHPQRALRSPRATRQVAGPACRIVVMPVRSSLPSGVSCSTSTLLAASASCE